MSRRRVTIAVLLGAGLLAAFGVGIGVGYAIRSTTSHLSTAVATSTGAQPSPHAIATPSAAAGATVSPAPSAVASPISVGLDARQFFGTAYDRVRKDVVIFGGRDQQDGTPLNDTWTFDGSNWKRQSPQHSPPARITPAMAWDDDLRIILLFGGRAADNHYMNDTWEWDGSDWIELFPNPLPPADADPQMADYVPNHVMLLSFHSRPCSCLDAGTTYAFDGVGWQTLTMSQNPGNGQQAGFFALADCDPGCMVAYRYQYPPVGGPQMWVYIGSGGWFQRTVANQPQSTQFVIASGPTDFLFLFGDQDRAALYNHNFSGRWQTPTLGLAPNWRAGAGLAYDPNGNRMLLFGGTTTTFDTWAFDLATESWKEIV